MQTQQASPNPGRCLQYIISSGSLVHVYVAGTICTVLFREDIPTVTVDTSSLTASCSLVYQ